MQQVHLLITGKVQDVWYRVFVKDNAEKLGLVGWVRNTDEGHVEAVVQGEKEKIEKLLALCRQGPELAEVKDIVISWNQSGEQFSEFIIR